jgi:S1-C subfamily serine protease
LKKDPGSYSQVDAEIIGQQLGADLETLDSKKADQYNIEGGVLVKNIRRSGKLSTTRMENGFIITSVSGYPVKSIEELSRLLNSARGTVKLEGIYPGTEPYSYPLNMRN